MSKKMYISVEEDTFGNSETNQYRVGFRYNDHNTSWSPVLTIQELLELNNKISEYLVKLSNENKL